MINNINLFSEISNEGRLLQKSELNITQNFTISDYYAVEPFQLTEIFLKNEFAKIFNIICNEKEN